MTGIETTVVTAIANGFIGQIAKSGWDGIIQNELLNKDVGQLVKERKYLFLKEYAQRYWDRHGMIKVLKMSKPMNLESIYINVKCLEHLVRDYYDENLENKYRESKQRGLGLRDGNKQDGLLFANQEQYLMVFGDPGIGKSTFLRKIGLEALKGGQGNYRHPLTPVLLELKNFKETEIDIQAAIKNEFKLCGFPNVEKNISKKLEQGELLILLDGLDEVPSDNINDVVKKIQDFVDLYDKNRFVISCRTAFRKNFKRFTDIEIVEFDDQQIKSFIKNWFVSELDPENETAKNCWELLQKEEYKSAKELCQTPLLLTFLCLIYQKKQSLPTDRSILYQEALDILLEEWAEHNELQENRSIDKKLNINLNVKIEKLLLSKIAYDNFLEDKLFFWEKDIVYQIESSLQEVLNFSQNPDGRKILKTIEVEQGILVERARGKYSFSHLTFQEYLTAQYVYDNDLIEEVVKNHITEVRWKEVFLLIAGLMRGKADKLLLAMEKETLEYAKNPQLYKFLTWVEEATGKLKETIKPSAKRSIIIFDRLNKSIEYTDAYNIIHSDLYNNYLDGTPQFDEPFLKQLDELRQGYLGIDVLYQNSYGGLLIGEQIPSKETVEYISKLGNSIMKTILRQLEFDRISAFYKQIILDFYKQNPISFSGWQESDWIVFKNYLYVNELILSCKEVAVNISPSVWQEIEDRMLRVP